MANDTRKHEPRALNIEPQRIGPITAPLKMTDLLEGWYPKHINCDADEKCRPNHN